MFDNSKRYELDICAPSVSSLNKRQQKNDQHRVKSEKKQACERKKSPHKRKAPKREDS